MRIDITVALVASLRELTTGGRGLPDDLAAIDEKKKLSVPILEWLQLQDHSFFPIDLRFSLFRMMNQVAMIENAEARNRQGASSGVS